MLSTPVFLAKWHIHILLSKMTVRLNSYQISIIIPCCEFQSRTQPVSTWNISEEFRDVSFLHETVLKLLHKIDIVFLLYWHSDWRHYNSISVILLQRKRRQHNTLMVSTISKTGKTAKMAHSYFFGEDGDVNLHHSDSEN